MKLSKVSRGSVAALIAVMLVGAGVLWALADRPASAENTPTSASDELRNVTQSQTIQVEGQSFEIPMLDEYYGSVVIGGIEYPLNQAGQSYGSASIAEAAYVSSREGVVNTTFEELFNGLELYLPDLVCLWVNDGEQLGYVSKADYLDMVCYTPFDQWSWPEHQDGVDDFKYYPAYEADGVTQIGTAKRIAVNITESCILSDGTIEVVDDNRSDTLLPGVTDHYTDADWESLASRMGMDVNELKAKVEAARAN